MGRSLSYPWSVLDLAPTSDRAEIKRAYARKLKVTRPEDDAQGFHALLQAREAALATLSTGKVSRQRLLRGLPVVAVTRDEQERPAPPPQEVLDKSAAPVLPEPFLVPTPVVAEAVTTVPVPDMGRALEKALKANAASDVADQADMILSHLRSMSLLDRGAWEEKLLLAALTSVTAVGRDRTGNGRGSSAIFRAKLALLQALDKEFHWVDEDKRVHEFADNEDVEGFDTLMNLIRHGQPTVPLVRPVEAKSSRWQRLLVWGFVIYAIVKVLALLASL